MRRFAAEDRFSFRNELTRTYSFDEAGRTVSRKTSPAPEYTLHCFPMARAAREFFYHARFEPAGPKLEAEEYRRLVREVIARDSRRSSSEDRKIAIPGYASLAEFSLAHEALLKEECGSRLNSYTQRGNWRMVLPFTRGQQARTARALARKVERNLLPIVHLSDFPKLQINHAVMLTGVTNAGGDLVFAVYDPNVPGRFGELRFSAAAREFVFERTDYFAGGPVRVYEVYRNALF